MSTDQLGNEIGKLFVGGLHQSTTSETLKKYFSKFGEIDQAVVMMDHRTNRSRGFGYVKFIDSDIVESVVDQKGHMIDGKEVDAKLCNVNMKGKNRRSLKIFVGGIAPEQNEDTVRTFFNQYGTVSDVNLMIDPTKQRHRGFAFVGFEDEQVVKTLIQCHYVSLNGKQVEIKAMEPPNIKGGPNDSPYGRNRGNTPLDQMPNNMNGWAAQPQWANNNGGWSENQGWPAAWSGQGNQPSTSWGQWNLSQATGAAAQWDPSGQPPQSNGGWAAAAAAQQNSWNQAAAGASQWNWDPQTVMAHNGGAAGSLNNQWGTPQQSASAGYNFNQSSANGAAASADWRGNTMTQQNFHPYKR